MFGRKNSEHQPIGLIETLEERRLLSVTVLHASTQTHKSHHAAKHASVKHKNSSKDSTSTTTTTATSDAVVADTSDATSATTTTSTTSTTTDPSQGQGPGQIIDTLPFDETPMAVQMGLTTLAGNDGLSTPAITQNVRLGNANGIETYSIVETTTGTSSVLTVDQNGNAVNPPTTITWADLNGTGTDADAAAAAEISAIASALNLSAPTDSTVVNVSTTPSGSIYCVSLAPLASTSTSETSTTASANTQTPPPLAIFVDANGNPVGNQQVPFSVLSTTIQGYLNGAAPTGATPLASSSTQMVGVRTIDGVVTYSTPFTVSGTTTNVTVDLAGDVVTLPTPTTTTFDDIPSLAQGELQTLATAEGVSGTIATSQSVMVLAELNGTTIYTVTLSAADSDSSSGDTYSITLSSDALGNPTVPPMPGPTGPAGQGPGQGNGNGPVNCPPPPTSSSGDSGSTDSSAVGVTSDSSQDDAGQSQPSGPAGGPEGLGGQNGPPGGGGQSGSDLQGGPSASGGQAGSSTQCPPGGPGGQQDSQQS